MTSQVDLDSLQALMERFRSSLDESLVAAIVNDYDISDPVSLDNVTEILKSLSNVTDEAVQSKETIDSGPFDFVETTRLRTIFNPGNNEIVAIKSPEVECDNPGSQNQADQARSRDSFSSSWDQTHQLEQLREIFPELKECDLTFSFKRAKGNFEKALEDLLNVQYLKSTGQQLKGIDGFFKDEENNTQSTVNLRHQKRSSDGNDHVQHEELTDHMREFERQRQISFLSQRLNLSFDDVSRIYYEQNSCIVRTLIQILDEYIDDNRNEHTSLTSLSLQHTFMEKFKLIPHQYAEAITHITDGQPPEDIVALMNKHFSKRTGHQKIQLNYRLTPLPDEDFMANATSIDSLKTSTSGHQDGGRAFFRRDLAHITEPSQGVESMRSLGQASREANLSASQLHRRGASNSLYRQAASVYHARARDYADESRAAMSTAADLIVEGQSTVHSVDLHGVSVLDGVRIARQKARDWWRIQANLEEKNMRYNLVIITGLGRHSAGGVSPLRKAVAKALLQDGWKLNIETGKFILTGRT